MISLILTMAMATQAPLPAGLAAFIRDKALSRYDYALTDLNGDGRAEALVYAIASTEGGGAANYCGSGGCELYVLSLRPRNYTVISAISITQLPVRVLPTITHGWHDLSVGVAGGGIARGYDARLRFDGRRYPTNPSMPPARRLKKPVRGTIVIATQGK
ncbi:hypothetical protein RN629_09160 [Sphingomonadaceae bacterium jetA1]|jgi:hypothetical protein|uniref:hypothetical protein n=1 Tax=Facivitalis istanbulensis TaxID=3075838 RepID=UPI00349AB8DC